MLLWRSYTVNSNANKAILSVSNDLIYRINHECYCILNNCDYYYTTYYDKDFFDNIRLLLSKHDSLLIIFTPTLFPIREVFHFPHEKEDIIVLFDKMEPNRVSLILTHSTNSIDFLDNYWRKYSNCGLIDSLYLASEVYLIRHSYNHNNTSDNNNLYSNLFTRLCKDYDTNIMITHDNMKQIVFVDHSKYSYQNNNNTHKYFRNYNFMKENIYQYHNKSFYVHVPVHDVYDVMEYFPLADKCLLNERIKYLVRQEIYYVSRNYSIAVRFTNTSIIKVLHNIRESSSYITLYQHKIKVSTILNMMLWYFDICIVTLICSILYCGVLLGHKFDILARININYTEKKHRK